jgi:hypothetical protein
MRTSLSGPVIIFGNDNPQQISDTDSGPNIDYQSNALLDSRYASQATAAGEGNQAGVLALHNPVQIQSLNGFPVAAAVANIAASQTPAASAFFTLASVVASGIAPNMPLIPQGTPASTNAQFSQPNAAQPQPVIPGSANLVNVIALDFGFALGTTTTAVATATTVTITGPTVTLPAGNTASATYATRYFYPGQRIMIAGAGNAAGTVPLSTIVLATDRYASPGIALAAAGTITIANPALFAITGTSIGSADQEYGVAVKPVVKAGATRIYDPSQLISRVVTVTNGVGGSGSVTVRGYDIYEQPMSQIITITASTTVAGTKAFKYISSVQANAGAVTTGGVSIGTAAIFGLPARADEVEYQLGYFGGVAVPIASYVMADQTTPATNTVGGSGDVRGTVAVTANGTTRLVVLQTCPLAQAVRTTNLDSRGIFGVVQA